MAVTLATLLVKLEANTGGFNKGINTATKGILAFGAAAGGVTAVTARAAANIENQKTALKNLTGSATEAARVFNSIQDFAIKTPFETDELLKSTTALLGFGRTANQALGDIRNLAAAAASSADADLRKIAVNFGQISAAGKASARDLREFVNQGVNVYGVLADSLGVTISKVQEMQTAGKITGEVLAKAFKDAASAGGRFENTLVSQSKTLNGLVSTLKSQFAVTLANIGETILPAAKIAVTRLIAEFNKLDRIIRDNQTIIRQITAGFIAFIQSIGVFTRNIIASFGPLRALFNQIKAVKQALSGEFSAAADSASRSMELLTNWFKEGFNIGQDIKEITDAYNNALKDLVSGGGRSSLGFLNQSVTATKSVTESVKELGSEAVKATQSISALAQAAGKVQGPKFKPTAQRPGVTPIPTLGAGVARTEEITALTDTGATENLELLRQKAVETQQIMQGLSQVGANFATSFSNGIANAIVAAKSFKDAWKNTGKALVGIFKQLIADLIVMIIKTLVLHAITTALTSGTSAAADGAAKVAGGAAGAAAGVAGAAAGAVGGAINVTGRLSGQDILLAGSRAGGINGRFGG